MLLLTFTARLGSAPPDVKTRTFRQQQSAHSSAKYRPVYRNGLNAVAVAGTYSDEVCPTSSSSSSSSSSLYALIRTRRVCPVFVGFCVVRFVGSETAVD